ncbi:glycosyltransferase [Egicoccus sp. AB-alg2]|uniref:glycosyltransferase n=1 Tax=Egicoccus sp. AB-alg2 TaxID=3242693 RepID=UPI00359E7013
MTGVVSRTGESASSVPAVAGSGLRLVFLANSVARGGAETQLVRAAVGLAERGHRVTVARMLDWPGHEDDLAAAGIPLVELPARRPVRAASALTAGALLLRRLRPHAVVSFDYQANLLGRLAGRAAGVPAVVSSIRADRFGGAPREWWIRRTDGLAAVTTTNAARVARRLVERGLVHPDRLVVIPNAVDDVAPVDADTRARVRGELAIAPDEFVFLALGHIAPRKDHATMLRAAARARRAGSAFRLLIAGDGDTSPLADLAGALGITADVHLLGWRDDVADLLAASDALVSSSAWEGTPNAAIEALMREVPVVATRAGGTEEVVEDEVSGFLVDVGDWRALADRLARTCALPAATRAAMGAHGQAHVRARHDRERVLDQWEALLQRVTVDAVRG